MNGSNFVGGNANDPSPINHENHGNACAGIIAATRNNGEGIAGIAPNVRIMPVRMLGATPANVAASILFAANNGADIISCSWGYNSFDPNFIPAIASAIDYAVTNGRGGKGSLVVFAAGNTASHGIGNPGVITFPANVNISGVFTVGASDRYDLQAEYSPTSMPTSPNNQIIDIVAPSHRAYPGQIAGETLEIWSIDRPGNTGDNPWPNIPDQIIPPTIGEQYPSAGVNFLSYTGRFGGTSAAAPQISGIAALVLSINPNLSQLQVYDIITNSADKAGGYTYSGGKSNEFGFGRANACRAVDEAYASTNPITGPSSFCTSDTYTISGLPTGQSVSSWSANPSAGVTLSGSGSTVTVTRAGTFNGKVTLTASITSSCGTYDISKEVQVGTPTPEITNIYVYPQYGQIDVLINTVPGATSYEYYIDGVLDGSTLGSSHVYSFYGVPCGYTYHLSVKAIGPCGPSWEDVDFAYLPCVSPFTVSPNPANGSLTVTAEVEDTSAKGTGNQPAGEFNVKLYNGQGRLLREAESMNGSVTLDTQELPEGTHYLHISRGKETVKRQVVIKH